MFPYGNKNIKINVADGKQSADSVFVKDDQYEKVFHDLMESINTVLAAENIISKRISEETKESIDKYLKSIKLNCYRMINLANSLNHVQNLFKIDKEEFVEFNLKELIENLIISFTPYAEKKNINLKLEACEKNININSGIKSIDRILTNIVYNAIKYTEENGNVTIILKYDEKNAIIVVDDDGIGIPEEKISSLFVKYEKVDNDSEGLGIGLYIANEMAKMLGGEIKVESIFGKGSKFTFTLPI